MLTKIIWAVVWFLIKNLLNVAGGLINTTFEAVKHAETLEMPPEEKRQYVFECMIEYMTLQREELLSTNKLNALIELALVTIRSENQR